MSKDLTVKLRGAEWRGISVKIQDMTNCEQQDIAEWLLDVSKQAEARSCEAYSIARILDNE